MQFAEVLEFSWTSCLKLWSHEPHVICFCRSMVKIWWVMICQHPNCKSAVHTRNSHTTMHHNLGPEQLGTSLWHPPTSVSHVKLWGQQVRVAVVHGYGCRYDSGSNTSLTEWKTIFPLRFSPICLVFTSCPPPPRTYKGKLSIISIFRWFIAFGSGTSGGCANLCQGFFFFFLGGEESPFASEQYWEPVTAAVTPFPMRLTLPE